MGNKTVVAYTNIRGDWKYIFYTNLKVAGTIPDEVNF
jgi:hypothetical protein